MSASAMPQSQDVAAETEVAAAARAAKSRSGPAAGARAADDVAADGAIVLMGPVETASAKAVRLPKRAPKRPAVSWSAEREAIFLETLARTCSVANAAQASGLSSAAIYRRRDASDTFRAAWAQALREAYTRLETELLGRALNGVRKPVWYAGKKVGSVVEYADRLALALLSQYRETCRGSAPTASPQAEARIILIETLSRMNRGMGGEG